MKSDEKWEKVGKIGNNWGKVVKSGEKWLKVGKSGENCGKRGKSDEKWERVGKVWKSVEKWLTVGVITGSHSDFCSITQLRGDTVHDDRRIDCSTGF